MAPIDAQLNWSPASKNANTLGNLISYSLGVALFVVTDRIGGQSMSRGRNVEFMVPVTWERLNRRCADFEARIGDTLTKLMPADMEHMVSPPAGGGKTTVLEFLVSIISRLSKHMG